MRSAQGVPIHARVGEASRHFGDDAFVYNYLPAEIEQYPLPDLFFFPFRPAIFHEIRVRTFKPDESQLYKPPAPRVMLKDG